MQPTGSNFDIYKQKGFFSVWSGMVLTHMILKCFWNFKVQESRLFTKHMFWGWASGHESQNKATHDVETGMGKWQPAVKLKSNQKFSQNVVNSIKSPETIPKNLFCRHHYKRMNQPKSYPKPDGLLHLALYPRICFWNSYGTCLLNYKQSWN